MAPTRRTTTHVQGRLCDASEDELKRLIGSRTTLVKWRRVALSHAKTFVLKQVKITHQVRPVREADGRVYHVRSESVELARDDESVGKNKKIVLPAGTVLNVLNNTDSVVLAYVSDFRSDNRLGQLTFRKGGAVVFVPYRGASFAQP